MDEPLAATRETPEDLLVDFMVAQETGAAPCLEDYERRLPDAAGRSRLRELHAALAETRRLLPVRMRAATLLADRYRLLHELGAGGFGKVWLATDERLAGRQVAVKVLSALASTRDVRTDLEREKAALALVDHPGIVQILDVGEHEGSSFLVMDLVRGITLADLVAALAAGTAAAPPTAASFVRAAGLEPDCPLAAQAHDWWRCCARILAEVLDALQAAHGLGIVHRDVKPGNVMLRPDGTAVLLDFGVARILDPGGHTTLTGMTGTLAYMAPEQCSGAAAGLAVQGDVYQAGRVLYELLTLRPALARDLKVGEMLERAREGAFPPPRAVAPAVPRALDAVCQRALEPDPRRRHPSARAFREDLQDFLDGLSPRHVRTSAAAGAVRGLRRAVVRRRRSLLAGAALALGTVIGAAIWAGAHPRVQLDTVQRQGRQFTLPVRVAEDGELFAFVVVLSPVATEVGRIPLVGDDGSPAVRVDAGTRQVTLALPDCVELHEQMRLDARCQVYRGAEARQMHRFQEMLLRRLADPALGGRDGVPLAQVQEMAMAFDSARGTGAAPLGAADLLGERWARAAVGSPP